MTATSSANVLFVFFSFSPPTNIEYLLSWSEGLKLQDKRDISLVFIIGFLSAPAVNNDHDFNGGLTSVLPLIKA